MQLALIFFSILASLSLWFAGPATPPVICRGKPIPIQLLPGPKMTGPSLPLRFGGTRPLPRPPINSFPSENALRLVIKSRDEFTDLWKRLSDRVPPGQSVPPPPKIDFWRDMVVVVAMGARPTSGYWTIIDGVCEVDGQIEVFVSNVEGSVCAGYGQMPAVMYPADAILIPHTDLPIVFRETQVSCPQWYKQFRVQ
jgi:hypothetical protein